MGGDLYSAPDGKAPSFLVAALKDPYSGNLDRIQIVKGWLDTDGESHEKVYDVVASDNRRPGPDGKLAAVSNTVGWTRRAGGTAPDRGRIAGIPSRGRHHAAFAKPSVSPKDSRSPCR